MEAVATREEQRAERVRVLRPDRIAVLIALGIVLWLLGDVLLIVFAGILIGVALDGATSFVSRVTRTSRGWSLVTVFGVLAVLAIVGTTTIIVPMYEQLAAVWTELPAAADRATAMLREHFGLRLELTPRTIAAEVGERIAPASAIVVGAALSMIIAVAIGVFIAINPKLYRRGLVQMVPVARRARIDEVIGRIGHALRWWLIGQACSMAILGSVTALTLWLLDVPLWLGLALLTALLTFIPYFGPLIASVPILLISFSQGLQTGTIVLVIYLVLQNVEGFFMTPAIQQRAVRLPPVVLIGTQLAMGALFGIHGLIMAAPFAAFAMVTVKALYVEDVLEKCVAVETA
jgi:predicted PurR-regulated permease PerM